MTIASENLHPIRKFSPQILTTKSLDDDGTQTNHPLIVSRNPSFPNSPSRRNSKGPDLESILLNYEFELAKSRKSSIYENENERSYDKNEKNISYLSPLGALMCESTDSR
jgi:hypothetical protein